MVSTVVLRAIKYRARRNIIGKHGRTFKIIIMRYDIRVIVLLRKDFRR